MATILRVLTRLFRSCLDDRFDRRGNCHAVRFLPRLECLENRLAPASLSQSGLTLTITLDSANEQLTVSAMAGGVISLTTTSTFSGSVSSPSSFTGFGGTSGTLSTASIGTIDINDTSGIHGDSVVFSDSGSNSYGQTLLVNLSDSKSGNIAFNGTSTFNAVDLTASTSGGAVTFATGSSLDFFSIGDVSLSSGASASLDLGNIFLAGEGSLSVSAAGTIDQLAGTTISADTGTFTITANSGDILLGGTNGSTSIDGGGLSPNLFIGGVTMTESGSGTLDNVSLRNISRTASLPTVPPLSTTGINNYSLYFDNTAITLPAITVSGALNVTAGGAINQTGALTAATANFTVRGNSPINLSSFANAISGSLGLNSPLSSQRVAFVNTNGIQIGNSMLGRGTLDLGAVSGDITTAAGGKIDQENGAATATFTLGGGSAIRLDGANDFTGPLAFVGHSLTTLSLTNYDPLATLANVTIPFTLANLTIEFDSASVVLPTLSLTSLTVTGEGIFQQTGSILTAGTAVFNTLGPINLSGANAITNIQLNTVFGPFPSGTLSQDVIAIRNAAPLNFVGTSDMLGQLSVSAGGDITESLGASIVLGGPATMPASFTTTSGDIILDQDNKFINSVSVTVSGDSSVVLVNGPGNGPLTLGNVVTAKEGGISAMADKILQAAGTSMTAGAASFVGANGITLENRGNTFLRSVVVQCAAGSVGITSSGPLSLVGGNISGNLDVTAGGAITQLPGFSLVVGGEASFHAGTAAITLTNSNNSFGTLSLNSVGTAAVRVTSISLLLDQVVLGSGPLTLVTPSSISQTASKWLYQFGPGSISLTAGERTSVILDGSQNVLLGDLTIAAGSNLAGSITVNDQGNLNIAALPATAYMVKLSATGALTLPSTPFTFFSLTASSRQTSISSDITTTGGGVEFIGPVVFSGGNRTVDTSADHGGINFEGDVSTLGAGTLTLNPDSFGVVTLGAGVWNQGTNNLTINGSGALLYISGGATFAMTSGTISMPDGGDMDVADGGTFMVGTPGGAQTVTLNNGSGTLGFNALSRFEVGLGSTNAKLVKQGSGNVAIQSGAALIGDGLASTTASPVLTVSGGGTISGAYQDVTGSDFFAATSSATQVIVVQVDKASSGTVAGFSPDGDQWTVTTSLGAAAGLVVLQSSAGTLSIVVRNNTFSSPWTLTVTTIASGGDGFTPVTLIATNAPGPVTINAPTADLDGGDPTIRTAGTLAALNVRDMGTATNPHISIEGGGPATGTTTITAGIVMDPDIELNGILSSFKAQSVSGGTFTAQSFGSITITGNAASFDPGNFGATLRSTTSANGTVLGSATIAGTLGRAWDLSGAVGIVVAAAANDWTLGQTPGPGDDARNSHLLTNVTALNLGTVTSSNVLATGLIASLTAAQIEGSNLVAGSFGTIKTTGSIAANLVGDLSGTTIAALDAAGSTALGTLSVAGSLNGTTVEVADGNVTSISIGRSVDNGTQILAHFYPLSRIGQIGSITAGAWDSSDVTANSIGTFKIVGSLPANLFGDFTNSTVTLDGNAGGSAALALGTFSASGNMDGATFSIQDGNVTAFSVAGQIANSQVNLTNPLTSRFGSVSAGDWLSTSLIARAIGTFMVTGTLASFQENPSLPGDLASASVTAFQSSGATPAIGTFKVNGSVNASTIAAARGITSVSVGRSVENSSEFLSTDSRTGNGTVGRIGSLTVGAWFSSDLLAASLGMAAITGFSTLENSTPVRTAGDWLGGDFVLLGVSPLPSMTIAGMMSNALLIATGGIKTLSVAGSVLASNVVTAGNNPSSSLGAGHVHGGRYEGFHHRGRHHRHAENGWQHGAGAARLDHQQ